MDTETVNGASKQQEKKLHLEAKDLRHQYPHFLAHMHRLIAMIKFGCLHCSTDLET
jgi:hypothetical protein